MDRNTIVEMLREGRCYVTFTKKDGTKRVMLCTLNSEDLMFMAKNDAIDLPDENSQKTKNEDVVCVVDMEKEAWRSFRVDSVEKCELVLSSLLD